MSLNKKDYSVFGNSVICFSRKDKRKIEKMKGKVSIISTVCPDYPSDGYQYTFDGQLGVGVSLTTQLHLRSVPKMLDIFKQMGIDPFWIILVADLPELTKDQKEFYNRVAGSKEEYLKRCEQSVLEIRKNVNYDAVVKTFSSFYGDLGIPYLGVQEKTALNILEKTKVDTKFGGRFMNFVAQRRSLAEKFRGKRLSDEELRQAGAHGISLYATHGSLLRKIYLNQNLIIINHLTINLQNFFAYEFVDGCEIIQHMQKFPVGVLDEDLY